MQEGTGSVRFVSVPDFSQMFIGPVRFGSVPRPVPAGSEIKRFGSGRFGRVRFGLLFLPAGTLSAGRSGRS